MITCKKLSLADVKRIAAAAEVEAVKRSVNVSIAVCDEAGNLLSFQRMDGATLLSVAMAQAKARTAALVGRPTKVLQQIIDSGMPSLSGAPGMEGAFEGGVPILFDGETVGSVGVSGGPGEDDAGVATIGAAAL